MRREGEQKLWVRTPYPVTSNVWNFFVKTIFPQFNPTNDIRHSERYINDAPEMHRAELADGQYGVYHTHAYLPYDERGPIKKAQWGVIYVPREDSHYIDKVRESLAKKDLDSILAILVHKEKMSILPGILALVDESGMPDVMGGENTLDKFVIRGMHERAHRINNFRQIDLGTIAKVMEEYVPLFV